jgi:molecular chaperone GrpE
VSDQHNEQDNEQDNEPAPDLPRAEAAEAEVTGDASPSADELAAMVQMEPVDGSEHARVVAERDDYLDSLRRLQADFDNYRKRMVREQELAIDRGVEKLVNKLLPILDNFELALSHEPEPDGTPLAKTHDALLGALEGEGLVRIAPTGEVFDPAVADAVMHEDGDGSSDGPVVTDVMRAGYSWKGRVMRPAMVKVRG